MNNSFDDYNDCIRIVKLRLFRKRNSQISSSVEPRRLCLNLSLKLPYGDKSGGFCDLGSVVCALVLR